MFFTLSTFHMYHTFTYINYVFLFCDDELYMLKSTKTSVLFCSYFCRKLGKILRNLSSAAVVIGALRVKKVNTFKNRHLSDRHGAHYLSRGMNGP